MTRREARAYFAREAAKPRKPTGRLRRRHWGLTHPPIKRAAPASTAAPPESWYCDAQVENGQRYDFNVGRYVTRYTRCDYRNMGPRCVRPGCNGTRPT